MYAMEPLKTKYSSFVNLKEYKPGTLHYPSEYTFDFFFVWKKFLEKNEPQLLTKDYNL